MQVTDFSNITINELQQKMIEIKQMQDRAESQHEHYKIQDIKQELLRGYFGSLLKMFDDLEYKDTIKNETLKKHINTMQWQLDHFRREQVVDSTDALIHLVTRRLNIHSITLLDSDPNK